MPDLVTITGIEEVEKMLAELPRVVVADGFLKAFQAADKVISIELAVRTPVGPISADIANRLSESQVSVITLDSNFRGGTLNVGFGKQGHVALWVEYGHKNVGHKPGKKQLKGPTPAHPFMRKAADAAAGPAIEAFANSLAATLKAAS